MRNLPLEDQKFKLLILQKTKFLRNFSTGIIFITASNQELGSRFRSLQLNLHELCVSHVASVS